MFYYLVFLHIINSPTRIVEVQQHRSRSAVDPTPTVLITKNSVLYDVFVANTVYYPVKWAAIVLLLFGRLLVVNWCPSMDENLDDFDPPIYL
jgi:hypothetical protein